MPVFLGAGNHWSFGVPSKEDPRFASRIVEKEQYLLHQLVYMDLKFRIFSFNGTSLSGKCRYS